jgi:hypothetical protein
VSFANEIKDFISAFKSGREMFSESPSEEKARKAREDEEAIKLNGDAAAGAVGSYGGEASSPRSAIPTSDGDSGYGGTGSPRMRSAAAEGGDGTVRNASLQEKADRAIPAFAAQAGSGYGISPSYMKTTAMVESDANPNAVSSTGARGPYQFTRGTQKAMGLKNPNDWRQSAEATAQLAAKNRDALAAKLGRPVKDEEIYLAHNQGSAGAAALLRNPSAPAAQALAPALGGNVAKAAHHLRVNGVNPGVPAGDAAKTLMQKYNRKRVAEAIPSDDGADDAGGLMDTQQVQMAEDGGRIRSADEIEEARTIEAEEARTVDPDQRARMRRPADAPFMAQPRMAREVPSYYDADKVAPEPTTGTEGPDEAHEVTPVREAIPEAATVPAPAGTRTVTPDGTVRATSELPAQNAPTPPSRPSEEELRVTPAVTAAPREAISDAPQPPARPAAGQLKDNGAPLPGEYMTPGQDAPQHDPRRYVKPEVTAQATKGVMDSLGEMLGITKTALPGTEAGYDTQVKGLVSNAASPADVRAVDQTIDPQGTLNPAARAIARMNAGYEYYLQKGEPDKALKYAASMVLYARTHSMMAGRLAQAALKAGDVQGAAGVIVEAHNQLPDGKALKVDGADAQGASYSVFDADGQVTEKGKASLDQLMHLATGMRDGSVWLQQMGELTRMVPKGPSQSDKLRQQKYDDKQAADAAKAAKSEAAQEASNAFDAAGGEDHNDFLASLNPEQKAAYEKLDDKGKRAKQNAWRDQRKIRLSEDKANAAEQDRVKAGQDEQEYTAHADRVSQAEAALAAIDPNDPQNGAALQAAREGVEKAKADALKWSEGDAGRAKFGDKLRGKPGRAGATRQAIPDAPAYGAAPKGATKEQKEDAALDGEIGRSRNDMMRQGTPLKSATMGHDITRADVEFRRRYGKDADVDLQQKVDEALPKDLGGQDRFAMRHLGEQIATANGMMPDEAVQVANEAIASGGTYSVTQDGKVQFGNAPPVYLGKQGLLALAGILGRRKTAEPAKTTTQANPFGAGGSSPAAQRMAIEDRAENEVTATRLKGEQEARTASRRESRKRDLGDDYREGMNDEQIVGALKDKNRETSRKISRDPSAMPGAVY